MDTSDDIENIIFMHKRRLQVLKTQHAAYGLSADPKIIIEIEDIEENIKELQQQLDFTTASANRVVVHNLPGKWEFVDRHQIREEFREAIASNNTRTIVIDASGGMGKSALALEIAYEYLDKSKNKTVENPFMGFIWISDKEINISLESLIDRIARHFNELHISQSSNIEYKKDQALKLLSKTKTFLIIDNFETIEDSRILPFILSISEPTKIVITSRRKLDINSWNLSLNKLDKKDSLELMKLRAKRLNIDQFDKLSDETLEQLYSSTGGSPLAIMWSIGQIKQQGQTIDIIINGLNHASSNIFSYLFDHAWSLLSVNSKLVLKAISVYPHNVSFDSLLVSSSLNKPELRNAISQLTELWFVEGTSIISESENRYFLHPLTKSFAQAELEKSQDEKYSIYEAAIESMYKVARTHGGLVPSINDYESIQLDLNNIIGFSKWCKSNINKISNECIKKNIKTIELISVFLWGRGYWNERIELCILAYNMASTINSNKHMGWQANAIAFIKQWQNDLIGAEKWAWLCLKSVREDSGSKNLCIGYSLLGQIYMSKKEYDLAKVYLITSLALVSEDSLGVESKRSIHCNLGMLSYETENYKDSENWLSKAVIDAIEKEDREGESINKSLLARTIMKLDGRLEESILLFEEALLLAHKFKRSVTIARCELGLTETSIIKKNKNNAELHLIKAVKYFEQLGMQREISYCKSLEDKINSLH